MTNKFQTFFEKPYEEICSLIRRYINNNTSIIDLGCNNGNLEDKIEEHKTGCLVYGVDTDTKALESLRNKKYKRITVKVFEQDVNKFLKSNSLSDIDIILINATIHEINTPENQTEYLNWFFQIVNEILKRGGMIIVGDYYYPLDVSDEEVEAYLEYQRKEINHADPRNKFILPDLLKSKAVVYGYSVVYLNELRAVKEIDRRYYSFVFKKNNGQGLKSEKTLGGQTLKFPFGTLH